MWLSHLLILSHIHKLYFLILQHVTLWAIKWVYKPIYTHTKPGGRLKWPYAKSPGWQPTLCVAWCLICWFALAYKKYGHTWHRMSLLRPGVIKQHKSNNMSDLIASSRLKVTRHVFQLAVTLHNCAWHTHIYMYILRV